MLSMTGFAQKNITIVTNNNKIDLSISLKSVNNRFFESQCRLPAILSSFEIDITRFLKKKLIRGQVYCFVLADSAQFKTSLVPSLDIIKQYINLAENLKETFGFDKLSVNTLLTLPNVFSTGEKDITNEEKVIFFEKLEFIVDDLIKDRIREGNNLKEDLVKRYDKLKDIMAIIEPEAIKAHQEQLAKIEAIKLVTGSLAEEHNLLMAQLDKLDLNEEITRFTSHLNHFKNILESKEDSKGKELDFVLQEISREINTIGAKTNSYLISNNVVFAKVELEKAKEQIQNIV